MSCRVDGRRRSRIDGPIQNAADAPPEDNLATASGADLITERLEAPNSNAIDEVTSREESSTSSEECNQDNISFELVTGYDCRSCFLIKMKINKN